ncbi:hypothetical protein OOJ91_09025 [Micromonospora lupini]|uniref:hypothetical protein n=1 Tax=Micromonospora lupini TaxID=285679 RepID=UPI002258673D|nr:hypothetical protein [Micromonospora lupini]MCX5066024.1 hypothetical protein [Micromonospora lupini]
MGADGTTRAGSAGIGTGNGLGLAGSSLDPAAETTARDLTDRESSCCSFFTFTYTHVTGALRLDVQVPAARVDVLDALTQRAASNAS